MNKWTTDRPTKPGKYWLSIEPGKRSAMRVTATPILGEVLEFSSFGRLMFLCRELNGVLLDDERLIGAQWLPYVEPPDPFAEPVPSLRERVEALPTYGYHGGLDEIARRRGGAYLLRSEVLALLDEVTR